MFHQPSAHGLEMGQRPGMLRLHNIQDSCPAPGKTYKPKMSMN